MLFSSEAHASTRERGTRLDTRLLRCIGRQPTRHPSPPARFKLKNRVGARGWWKENLSNLRRRSHFDGLKQSAALAWLQDWSNTYGSSLTFSSGQLRRSTSVIELEPRGRGTRLDQRYVEAHASTQGCSAALGASPPDINNHQTHFGIMAPPICWLPDVRIGWQAWPIIFVSK